MSGLQGWLKRPFPMDNQLGQKLMISLLFGVFISLFLLIFKPFTFRDSGTYSIQASIGYGLITTLVMILNFLLLPVLSKGWFDSDRFTVWRTLVTSLSNVACIAFFNWLFYRYGPLPNEKPESIFFFMGVTLSVGIFPIILMIFWFERIYFMRYSRQADRISGHISSGSQSIEDSEVKLLGEGKTDNLTVRSADLICMKSEGNYVFVFYRSGAITQREILRGSLKTFEQQLSDHPQFIRCHQSYVINRDLLVNISGNARGYLLDMKDLEQKVPVSRNFEVSRLSR